jgi:membrane peptidoglycan carboxypeptidase
MLKEKPQRRRVPKLAIAGAAAALCAVLFLFPPVQRALGGLLALSADGVAVTRYPEGLRRNLIKHNGGYVDYAHIPNCLDRALISVEDKRFMLHGGIDPIALVRVVFEDVENNRVDHGGSTLTLQLARMMLHISRRQPAQLAQLTSKLRMVRAALIIEHDFSKQKILELYFNAVYLGRGATGVSAAAQAYFNMPLQKLNEGQCIYMAGLPLAPARFGADPPGAAAMARYRHVIATMQRNGFLTEQQATAVAGEPLFSHLSAR